MILYFAHSHVDFLFSPTSYSAIYIYIYIYIFLTYGKFFALMHSLYIQNLAYFLKLCMQIVDCILSVDIKVH